MVKRPSSRPPGGAPGRRSPKMDKPPYVTLTSPTAWSTLRLTIGADGSSRFDVKGASPFPRHWIYDANGDLAKKSASIDFSDWTHRRHDADTPWGNTDYAALVTDAESPLERHLSLQIMQGGPRPMIAEFDRGETLIRQGDEDEHILLVLDGVVSIDISGDVVAEAGPGAVLGEMAARAGGRRTATVTAVTAVKAAITTPEALESHDLIELAVQHQRETPR